MIKCLIKINKLTELINNYLKLNYKLDKNQINKYLNYKVRYLIIKI